MKVILVNGSPNKNGNTSLVLAQMQQTFIKDGIEAEIFHIGNKSLNGCRDCGACSKTGACVFNSSVQEFVKLAKEADGFIFGSPVHYAGISGGMKAFLDTFFYSADPAIYRYKPAASVVVARRGGTTAAFDEMNKYFTISQMPVISSCYWNNVHGAEVGEVMEDLEGLRIVRTLAHNMAYFLKCIEAGKNAGVTLPEVEPKVHTNFIR